jgi:hypothetical protein
MNRTDTKLDLRSEPKLDLRGNTEFDPPKLPIPWSDRLLNPIYAMLAIFNLKLPRTAPGQLYQRCDSLKFRCRR